MGVLTEYVKKEAEQLKKEIHQREESLHEYPTTQQHTRAW
jgi:hypothetical protein